MYQLSQSRQAHYPLIPTKGDDTAAKGLPRVPVISCTHGPEVGREEPGHLVGTHMAMNTERHMLHRGGPGVLSQAQVCCLRPHRHFFKRHKQMECVSSTHNEDPVNY